MISEAECIDNMEYMARFPDKFFDLAIVDPPYFEGPNRRQYYGQRVSIRNIKRIDYPVINSWDIPGHKYFTELIRVSKEQIVWGCNYFKRDFGPGRIIWDKVNSNSSFSDCEEAYCSMHDSIRLFRYMWNGMMQGKSIIEGHIAQGDKSKNEKRIHPTQKPVALYRWLLQKYAKKGDKILDTHLGSQSSRIAAHIEGFDFWGCELDEEYFERGCRRYDEHIMQQTLF